jgi:NAD kinase
MKNNIYVVYYKPSDKEEELSLKTVLTTLDKLNVKYKAIERKFCYKGEFKGAKLIIVVGGDGTFLRVSHYVKDAPLFGVNSHCGKKEGFFMHCTRSNFEKKINKLLKGFKTKKLLRLDVLINGKSHSYPALNDIFFGHNNVYKLSRFDLTIKKEKKVGVKEHQKCSGLITSTPAGSYAWAVSAGGKTLPLASTKWQYLVREQYEWRLHKHKFNKGLLNKDDILRINVLRDDYIIAIDSLEEIKLKEGDVVTIKPSKKYLNYVDL